MFHSLSRDRARAISLCCLDLESSDPLSYPCRTSIWDWKGNDTNTLSRTLVCSLFDLVFGEVSVMICEAVWRILNSNRFLPNDFIQAVPRSCIPCSASTWSIAASKAANWESLSFLSAQVRNGCFPFESRKISISNLAIRRTYRAVSSGDSSYPQPQMSLTRMKTWFKIRELVDT